MYIQEDLTTTSYEIPDISWNLTPELQEKFNRYGAFSKLILNEDRTAIADIVEDTSRRAAFEEKKMQEASEEAFQMQRRALENQGITAMARMMFRTQAATMEADDIIRCRGLAEVWKPGAYSTGDVRLYENIPYSCCQSHDSTANSGWNPADAPSLWSPYHGTSPDAALPYKPPTGAHDVYKIGECITWTDGRIMQAVQDTNFSPEEYPTAWKEVIT